MRSHISDMLFIVGNLGNAVTELIVVYANDLLSLGRHILCKIFVNADFSSLFVFRTSHIFWLIRVYIPEIITIIHQHIVSNFVLREPAFFRSLCSVKKSKRIYNFGENSSALSSSIYRSMSNDEVFIAFFKVFKILFACIVKKAVK